jgi:uncharacterized protein YijF (DUF1287 family)
MIERFLPLKASHQFDVLKKTVGCGHFDGRSAYGLLMSTRLPPKMSRSRSGYYNAIEYIGPRPQRAKRPNFFGGWVIVVIALCAAVFFGKPLIGGVWAADKGPTDAQVEMIAGQLESTGKFPSRLAAEALRYSGSQVTYDPSYYKIPYPEGDVPSGKGVAADMVIRCYRNLGIDLQKEIHEDMESNFRVYPQLWAATGSDTNIDHRRVPNLQRFFSRKGVTLTNSSDPSEYVVGDIVVWALSNAETHIGIVVPPAPGDEGRNIPWVVHHPAGGGVKWEKALFDHQILGHFRYPAE